MKTLVRSLILSLVLALCLPFLSSAQPQAKPHHNHHFWKTTRHVTFQVLMVPLHPVFWILDLGGCIP
jgi:hypothetical protein